MEGSAQEKIIQPAVGVDDGVHEKLRQPLRELGHHNSTMPPTEAPVVKEDSPDWIEDLTYNAKSGLQQAVAGGETNIRVTSGRRLGRWLLERINKMRRVNQQKTA